MAFESRGLGLTCWSSWGGDPATDLAQEELLLEGAAEGVPHLFLYAWQGPALVLGYGQNPEDGIDLPYCRRRGIPVLRRCSGGTAVLHQGDLSASLALPAGHPWAGTIAGLYDGFVLCIQGALCTFGVKAERFRPPEGAAPTRSPICFEDHRAESLLVGGRKVLGCAQTRRRHAVLVHGTLLFGLDADLQAGVYDVPPSRIEAAMAPLPAAEGLDPRSAARALAETLSEGLGSKPGIPSAPPPLPERLLRRLSDPKWVIHRGFTPR